VFISHASGDLAVATRVGGWLRDAGHSVFFDRDLGDGLRVGDA
jgi:TIR domain